MLVPDGAKRPGRGRRGERAVLPLLRRVADRRHPRDDRHPHPAGDQRQQRADLLPLARHPRLEPPAPPAHAQHLVPEAVQVVQQQERLVGQFAEPHHVLRRELVPRRDRHQQRLGEQLLDVQLVVEDRQGHHPDVQFPGPQRVQQPLGPVFEQPQPRAGVVLQEPVGDRRQQVRGDGRDRPGPQLAADPAADRPLGVGHRRQGRPARTAAAARRPRSARPSARAGRTARRRASFSSSRICWLSDGWVTPSRAAARVKLPASATATKYRSRCSSITPAVVLRRTTGLACANAGGVIRQAAGVGRPREIPSTGRRRPKQLTLGSRVRRLPALARLARR